MKINNNLKPSEYMRNSRPELFSDSIFREEPILPKAVLDHHLDTLTNRKEETVFEYFARKLAEKELAPNLLPQTGPTGGGDSKVDSETYPVSGKITERWYEGNQEAANERWAFAFSAKKDWSAKVKSDVKNVMSAKRDYKLIYFITNQYVRDKARSQTEDDLKKKYKIDIRILDRTWILAKVYDNNRLDLAISCLNLIDFDVKKDRIIGPKDLKRENELNELEKQILDDKRYNGVTYQLVEDCLRAAFLSRGLGKPRDEVDGKFERARRIADKNKHTHQLFRIIYHKAWTVFWWYEDYEELNILYDEVERLAIGSEIAQDLEYLSNLWKLLFTSVHLKKIKIEDNVLKKRTDTLKSELERLSSDSSRPNNALQAETNLVLMDFQESLANNSLNDNILERFKYILIKSNGLIDYSLDSFIKIIQELGIVFTDSDKYDDLLEEIVDINRKRKSEGEAGLLLLERAFQKLKGDKKYDAINLFGRAQNLLTKEEYKYELISALGGCAIAYENAGLLWAARANYIIAANQILKDFLINGKIEPISLSIVIKLVWLEMKIGRVFHTISYIEFASILANGISTDIPRIEKYKEERLMQDMVFGLLLFKIDFSELKQLDFMPDILENLQLISSRFSLLYALGYEDFLRKEGTISNDETPEALYDFFSQYHKQPANNDLPEKISLLSSRNIKLHSFILGCEIIIDVENTKSSICLAEIILSSLESFLSTSIDFKGGIVPIQSELNIIIKITDWGEVIPRFDFEESDLGMKLKIKHLDNSPLISIDRQKDFSNWLLELILSITFKIAIIVDQDSFAKRIKAEDSISRAINLVGVSIANENILGPCYKFSISDWMKKEIKERYPLKRDLPWDNNLGKNKIVKEEIKEFKPGIGDPPADLFGYENLKHSDLKIVSLLNTPLWDQAQLRASAFIFDKDFKDIPFFGLGFLNIEPAKRIFKQWLHKIGSIDEKEQIRIVIIKGIDKKNPLSYKVSITPSLKFIESGKRILFTNRSINMVVIERNNLDNFIKVFEKFGKYKLIPVEVDFKLKRMRPIFDLAIQKSQFIIRNAWEIGENDIDSAVIQKDDDPIIPETVKNAPILEVLKRKKY